MVLERAKLVELDHDGAAHGSSPAHDTVIVRGGLPGEIADVGIDHTKKNGVGYGKVIRVIEPAPNRVPVECPVFLDCGGCDLLHADLPTQHALKRSAVAAALELPLERVEPVAASPRAFGYRALAKLVVGPSRILGSYRPRSHNVVDMHGCVVHAPEVERVVEALRELVRVPDELDLRYVLVRASMHEGRAIVTLVSRTEGAPGLDDIEDQLRLRDDVAQIVHHVNDDEGNNLLGDGPSHVVFTRGDVVERIGPVEQSIASGAFSQINAVGAAVLYAAAVDAIAAAGQPVLDLYAGSGGLSLSLLAGGASKVTSIEAHREAVLAARASAVQMGIEDRLDAREASVESKVDLFKTFEHIVVNPPRKGLSAGVVAALAAADWRRLVYVSCDPDTLARDVRGLGGSITRVTPVDLFVHTRHVETVLTLER